MILVVLAVTLSVAALLLLPMLALRLKLGTLLAADTSTLAPATLANNVGLIVSPFTPSENLTLAGLTLASGNGLSPILCATGTQSAGIDPVTNQQKIILVPGAAGGFKWTSSGTFTSPVTVYGVALYDNGSANLWAVAALPSPIVIQAPGYILDLDPLQINFVLQPMS